MPAYKVSFIFNYGISGWSEQWYRNATSPQAATQFTNPQLKGYLGLKVSGTVIQAIRSTDVTSGLRSTYLNVLALGPSTSLNGGIDGAAGGLCFLGYVQGANGARRAIMYKGVAPSLFLRDNDGLYTPSASAVAGVTALQSACVSMGLLIKQLQPPNPPALPIYQVASLSPYPNNSAYTQITWVANGPATQCNLVFHGLSRRNFPGWAGQIPYAPTPNPIVGIVPIVWQSPATVLYPLKARAIQALYQYQPVQTIALEDVRTHKIGRPSLLPHGRRAATRYRAT